LHVPGSLGQAGDVLAIYDFRFAIFGFGIAAPRVVGAVDLPDVFVETKDDVFILGSIEVTAQFVGGGPERGFEAEV
jgi:hypothetical protein